VSDIRRVVVDADQKVVIEHTPPPTPGAGEALIRSVYSGVCGSDTHAQHGRHPHIRLPYAVGHEVVGVVQQVGADVSGLAPGDRVTVEPTLPCWACKQCRAGRINLCENLGFFGCGYPQGGMAELFTIPADRLHRIPDDVDDLTAALIEPLSTPVHAARLAGPLEGKAVTILGAGSIGLLVLAVARARGASRIVVSDVLENKRAKAIALGADAVVDGGADDVVARVREALGESADVVFDCVAIQSTLDQAVGMALKGGTVVVVGVPARDFVMPVVAMQDQEVRVQGSATYLPEDFAEAIELLRAGAVTADQIVTGEFPLERAGDAFDASTSGEHVKVLVRI
jgi:2-desacetyl-2-hydroxyethyl bacteriochlorophyllide A dehydrogenase